MSRRMEVDESRLIGYRGELRRPLTYRGVTYTVATVAYRDARTGAYVLEMGDAGAARMQVDWPVLVGRQGVFTELPMREAPWSLAEMRSMVAELITRPARSVVTKGKV